jgi:8-oxo-dGTP pyrophosphatase MutT (NUDIX family)
VSRNDILLAKLRDYAPTELRERADRDRVITLLSESSDPFDRHQFRPGHITASSFILSPDGQSMLLIEHAKLGLWLQPGGHVDPEDPSHRAACLREVEEEVGLGAEQLELLASPFDIDIHTIPARGEEPEHRHFDVRMAWRARTQAFVAGSDALAGKWVGLEGLSDLHTDHSVRRAAVKLRRLVG